MFAVRLGMAMLAAAVIGCGARLQEVSTIAGKISSGTALIEGPVATARLYGARGMWVDSGNSKLYVAVEGAQVIVWINLDSASVLTVLSGAVGQNGQVDGSKAVARFFFPRKVVRLSGFTYVTEGWTTTNGVRKVWDNGDAATLAGTTVAGYAEGTGSAASFSAPRGMTTDGTDLFVCDQDNHCIRKVTTAGVTSSYAGTCQTSGYTEGSPGTFVGPRTIGYSTAGTFFVTDNGNLAVRKISSQVVSTLYTVGQHDRLPVDMAYGSDGNMYVATYRAGLSGSTPRRTAATRCGQATASIGGILIRRMQRRCGSGTRSALQFPALPY
jgi:hypothetical protein